MTNKYGGKCGNCGQYVATGTGTVMQEHGRWVVYHTECPEITSGLGIGGIGSDDCNIHTERDTAGDGYQHGTALAGSQVCPAGTTYGVSDPGGRCTRCGARADYNPSAGQNLCARHWDEY